VKLKVPDVLGVPEINPEDDKDKPPGIDPEATEYVGASPESSVATYWYE
jgi:hypothetical protein